VVDEGAGQPTSGRQKVAILGGGMAGLAAAWRLTRPEGPRPLVTVYQRGWRLGGKGASSRGLHQRIEEHGLHVWPGYYDNAFRLIRSCYDELDREHRDPSCPIRDWRDGFFPASTVGLGDDAGDGWSPWVAAFPENDLLPGDAGDVDQGLDLADFVERAAGLLGRFGESQRSGPPAARAVLSSHPERPNDLAAEPGPAGAITTFATGLRALATLDRRTPRRTAQLAELLLTMIRGVTVDRLLERGYGAIDHLDFREWLAGHGATPAAVDSPLVRGLYDFVFGYEAGDTRRPRFAAGLGLHLTARMFLTYRGAIFWKMRAGMGDVVFAPLYQALARRGVRFEFFHRLDALRLTDDHRSIASIRLGRQAALAAGLDQYQPLVRVGGLPVFPSSPDPAQLEAGSRVPGHDLESHWCESPDAGTLELDAGRDFDAVVLAVSLGMVPIVAAELLEQDARWRAMTERVATVATQSCQVWLRDDERSLGWPHRAALVTGCGGPFDTFASMSHTIPFEEWPPDGHPLTAASFCSVLPDADVAGRQGGPDPARAAEVVRANAVRFLATRCGRIWPAATNGEGFRWDLLAGGGPHAGPDRFASQYWRANTDPSDRYVQSLPGTARFRLPADGSGFDKLALAGDWVDSGLNAGCIEAAVLAGIQAANAVEGRTLTEGTVGFRPTGADGS
jgi:uncharacterized protein with NAD-binding domain and iron-sulfur cluster